MAEIYRDSLVTLGLELPGATDITATVTRAGETVFTAVGEQFDLPFSVVGFDGPFTVDWSFTYGDEDSTRSESHDVVTPYVSIDEIRDEISGIPAEVTDTDLTRAERRVRKIIDTVCGQSFGKRKDSLTVVGRDGGRLRLPERLISYESISGNYVLPSDYYGTVGDGWYLAPQVPYGYGTEEEQNFVFTAVIRNPSDIWSNPFKEGYAYTLTGVWGWDSVPADVEEAALILIEYELCPDKIYRDRYIIAASYADTRLEFSPSASAGTGSATADKLLAPYTRSFMTVI